MTIKIDLGFYACNQHYLYMKHRLKSIIEELDPKSLGVNKISISSFVKLGIGEGNLNYFFSVGDKEFVCRVNIDKHSPSRSRNEFNLLKNVESLRVAPKAYHHFRKSREFPWNFNIIEFIKGKPFRMKKRSYTTNQIRQIARILAKLHSKKCDSLPKQKHSYKHYLTQSLQYNKTINKHNDRLRYELKQIHMIVRKFLPKNEEHKFSLIHGDVCPQNIIQTTNGLKLIDWESSQCSDPAKDIANVLVDLGLKSDDLTSFLEEYGRIRKDATILERANIYAVLFRYTYFLWEITRSFEIIHKKLPTEYLNKTTARSHINEAGFQFRKLSKLVNVPRIDVVTLFGTQGCNCV